MKKKRFIGTLLASSIAVTGAFAGCSLVSSNNTADMNQVIATVNISKAEGLGETDKVLIDNYKDAVGTTEIYKNELIAYYLNYGISYVNQGYPASAVFEMLINNLVENAVLTQYAVMYILNDKGATVSDYNSKSYIEKLEYLLTDEKDEEDTEKEIKIAKYNFYKLLNTTLDSYEKRLLEDEDSTAGTDNRSTPSGVDTEQDGFYPQKKDENGKLVLDEKGNPVLDYGVYTGYKGYLLADSGNYSDDVLEGSTRSTRTKAYNDFLGTLISNGLVDPKTDDLLRVTDGIGYMNDEYANQLENRVINKYYDLYEEAQEAKLTDDGKYEYLDVVYNKLKDLQKDSVDDNFESDIGRMSDTSFVLYSPDTEGEGAYGFVYNILLPFNSIQNGALTALKSNSDFINEKTGDYTIEYYKQRNELLKQIETTDQRAAWFNGATDYSFNAVDAGLKAGEDYYAGVAAEDGSYNRQYLFFENNLTKTDRFESLDKYIGNYAYNGKVYEMEDGGYQLLPEKLTIDGMLKEFKAYIDFVLGEDAVELDYDADAYYANLTEDTFYVDNSVKEKDKEIDYKNFIYATGKVKLGEDNFNKSAEYRNNIFFKESKQYKALAAVNELQYAYTTDTSVLSQYIGYTVTLGDTTGYIKEFETAAHEAIKNGPGSFNVCAGDYGWHLIYVTYTFDENGGDVYETPNWKDNVGTEGTFENFFYEWVKNNDIKEISTTRRTQIMTQFNKDTTVNKIQSAYQDLLDLKS